MTVPKSDSSAQETDAQSLPDDLQTPNSKLVYLYLQRATHATVNELSAALNMKKMTLLSILSLLVDAGHVIRDGDRVELK